MIHQLSRGTMTSIARVAHPPTASQRYPLRVGLCPVPATADEVRTEIGDRLIEHEAILISGQGGHLELRLTVAAGDVWQAALTAMAAITAIGYPPAWIEAGPVGRTWPPDGGSRGGSHRTAPAATSMWRTSSPTR